MNTLTFGRLINVLTIWGMRQLDSHEMGELHNMVTPEVPIVSDVRVSEVRVNALLEAMLRNEKIPAIKAYRELTGTGLREAKDAVEKYWINHATILQA